MACLWWVRVWPWLVPDHGSSLLNPSLTLTSFCSCFVSDDSWFDLKPGIHDHSLALLTFWWDLGLPSDHYSICSPACCPSTGPPHYQTYSIRELLWTGLLATMPLCSLPVLHCMCVWSREKALLSSRPPTTYVILHHQATQQSDSAVICLLFPCCI